VILLAIVGGKRNETIVGETIIMNKKLK